MKKILLLMMCCPMILSAQNGVTVSNLNVASGTVTFNVSWNNEHPTDFLWSDSVWVFVDYNNAGKMERLLLSGATLSAPSWSAATVIFGKDDNKQGAWVVGNARSAGSFSATVQLRSTIVDVAGACAYASNYPPIGEYTATNKIEFTGTPMYNVVLTHLYNKTDTIYRVAGRTYDLPEHYTLLSFTDATGAPGIIPTRIAPPPYAVSAQTWKFGDSTLTWSDLIQTAPPSCQQYQSLNSTAATHTIYHVHNVDNRIVFFYSWACVQASASLMCPEPWRVPTEADFKNLPPLHSFVLDMYGWQTTGCMWPQSGIKNPEQYNAWSTTEKSATTAVCLTVTSNVTWVNTGGLKYLNMPVRCVRQSN
jgi:hypothetical protein